MRGSQPGSAAGWLLGMRAVVSGSGSLETRRERALVGHQSGLRSVAFSPDSRHLLSCDAGGLIVQWNVRTGEREFDLRHRHQEEGWSLLARRTNGAGAHREARSRPTLRTAKRSYPRGWTSG